MEEERYIDVSTRTTYKSLLLLGKGGFAKCYKVRNEQSQEYSALKVIDRKNMNQNQYLKVQREIKIHKGLNHPHIVRLFNAFEDDKSVYIVMELCSEKSLLNLINDSSRISEADSQYYLRGIVSAVTFLLSYDIIHRDIKPGNILLKESGNRTVVKLADFGLACLMKDVSGVSVSGTPNYLAPEVLARRGHSSASEAWSIGCLLFCMVTGLPPFDSVSIKETYRRIENGEYSYPSHIGISQAAVNLIDGLLKVSVTDRLGVGEITSSAFMRSSSTKSVYSTTDLNVTRSCSVVASRTPSRVSYSALTSPSSPTHSHYSPPSSSPRPSPHHSYSTTSHHPILHPHPPPPSLLLPSNLHRLPPPAYHYSSSQQSNPAVHTTYGFDTTRSQSQSQHDSSSSLSISPSLPSLPFSDLNVHTSTLASLISGVRSITPVNTTTPLHISKWVDYSNKYGFGCLLSDGTTTVKFNSGEIVGLRSESGGGVYVISSTGKPLPLNMRDPHIVKMVELTRSYKKYMETQLAKAARIEDSRENNRWNETNTPYITHYSKKKSSLMVVLSDGTTQINFTSQHFKVIISPDSPSSSLLSFIDADGIFTTYRTSSLATNLTLTSSLLSLLRDSNEFISDEMSYLRTFHSNRASHPLTTRC